MAYDNTNKGAIWIKTAKSGLVYKTGKINVEGKEYKITMFDNDKAGNDARPDFNVIIEPLEGEKMQENNNGNSSQDNISVEDVPF